MTILNLQGGRSTLRPYENRADPCVCPYQNMPRYWCGCT